MLKARILFQFGGEFTPLNRNHSRKFKFEYVVVEKAELPIENLNVFLHFQDTAKFLESSPSGNPKAQFYTN